eukprot:SAG31_NODE_3929_length_3743_cov_1.472558_2_plen_92_part_00
MTQLKVHAASQQRVGASVAQVKEAKLQESSCHGARCALPGSVIGYDFELVTMSMISRTARAVNHIFGPRRCSASGTIAFRTSASILFLASS